MERSRVCIRRVLIAAGACLVATQVMADPGWTNGQQLIGNIMWRPGQHGFYVKGGTYHDTQNCPYASSNLYLLDPAIEQDVATTNRLFALMTLAMAQGKTIYVWLDGCQLGHPNFKGLQLND